MSVKWSLIGASTIVRQFMINAIRAQGEDSIWSSAPIEAALQTAKSGKAVAIDPELGSMN
ncbi:hypothetical protein LB559_26095 [Mesorhizobium sp. BR1-1-3]|uniref:hypothetical protein n=1 Tax=unclassified Mesorhizobium TaxID=325217 RepID=UPI001CD06D0C|nr:MULTISPECIES: hypothetical protein [unclassified Mesorhizobium]MBZ9891406.1 hypothetical protein [Mesorhizobium sp. BR1-1-3]MDF3155186.1 hypothetical protein [Mesorhizobium sp. XAP10]MDF3248067.1 hypothetical protein [Mesorhizobium sp. XAP4]